MKERSKIDDKYKWDLSSYIKDEAMLNDEFAYLEKNLPKFKDFYGKFSDKKTLLKFLKFNDEYDKRSSRLILYIYHSLDTDTSDTKFIAWSQRVNYLLRDIGEATSFISPQLSDLDEKYLNSLLDDKNFKDYRRLIQGILRDKPHKLSEHDSELVSKMSLFMGSASDIFDALTVSEIKFDDIEVHGKKYEVNEANYSKLMANKDREVRKKTLYSLMGGYGTKNKTLTQIYLSDIQKDIFLSRLENFSGVKEKQLFNEEVDSAVYDRLISQVNKNLGILHTALEEKRKILKLRSMAYYDCMVPISEDKKWTIEQAKKIVKNAVLPLGDEYQAIVTKKFEEKCIDYLPNKNKATGAYSSGCYGCPSIILMNFVDDLKSVYTLAHEMGHTMHTELSNMTQPYPTSDYRIFVAEVASTVNEMLLYNYLIKDADYELKRALVFDLVDEFRSTVYRQTMFSEFEDYVHTALENKQPKTYDDLNNYYLSLNKKYYGKNIEIPDVLKYEWSRIPHFYRPYCVYKYATGFISALCIVENIKSNKEYYKKYIKFLKSGSSKPVVELLQDIDVDLTTDEPYKRAFKFVKDQLKLIK